MTHGGLKGVGYETKMLKVSFFIEGRYHHGLRNIAEPTIFRESTKTRAFVLIMGIKI